MDKNIQVVDDAAGGCAGNWQRAGRAKSGDPSAIRSPRWTEATSSACSVKTPHCPRRH